MIREEFDLLITLALIVRSMSAPDDQRAIDRKIEAMGEANDRAREAEARAAAIRL